MKEIELKVLEVNPSEEGKKLRKLGFKKKWSGIIKEKFFDSESESLRKQKKLLRLRSAYDKVELVVKEKGEKHSLFKLREEKEVIVNSFEEAEKILVSLGFVCKAEREKKRTSYELKGLKVEIDEYPGAKPYLEIEGSKNKIVDLLKKLNHPLEKTSKKSSSGILRIYGLNVKKLKFKK